MEQPEDKPRSTGGLPKTAPRSTGGLPKTSPEFRRGFPLAILELYAFFAVFLLLLIASFVIPQRMLDEWELSILLFVVAPFLAWFVRIIYKSYQY
jgi:hypothetical protein